MPRPASTHQLTKIIGILTLLRQSVEQERAAVRALEDDLAGAQLISPAAGVVIAVNVREGIGADAGQPIVALARQDSVPLVLADVPTANASRLAVGQRVTMQYSGLNGPALESTIDRMLSPLNGTVRVEIRPPWPQEPPTLGSPTSVQVVVQERQDVLLVPERALRGAGPQRTVEIQDGAERRAAQVEVGLVANGNAEITRGLEAGVNVVVTP